MANTDDTQKMLRAIINGQSAFRQEVLSRIDKLDSKLTGRIDQVEKNQSEPGGDRTHGQELKRLLLYR